MDQLSKVVFASLNLPLNVVMRDTQIDDNGRYWITSDGRLISLCDDQPFYRKFSDNGNGYLQVVIGNNKYYLHRLLALSFNADPNKEAIKYRLEVHHLDFDKSNNSLSNLVLIDSKKHHAIHNIWKRIKSYENSIKENVINNE